MAISGETLYTGANTECADCKVKLVPSACQSAAGWYVGTWCGCGPYSRESGYFHTEEDAKAALYYAVSRYVPR